jgi:RNA polymerase sigma-70 factor (ECF subfamily)
MGAEPRPELDAYAVRLIRYRARQLVGTAGFTEDDVPDIVQDLTVDLLRRLPSFDPARASLYTFVLRVVEHGIARLLQYRRASMRDHRRCTVSLNDPVDSDEGERVEFGEVLDQDGTPGGLGGGSLSLADQVALRVGLQQVKATLTPELRDLWERLAQGQTLSEIANQLGIPRTTLGYHLKRLRMLVEEAGFGGRR